MDFPVAETRTSDGHALHGLFLRAKGSKTALIFIHGTASNFYENYFMNVMSPLLIKRRISVILANNRGNEVLKAYPPSGASTEHFEACVRDIDAWIRFALFKRMSKIILMGHSLGSEKSVYYMNKGKLKGNVKALILLGVADSYGTQLKYSRERNLLGEAMKMKREGRKNQFLRSDWLSHAGVLPKTADSYVNFFAEGSELSKALPLRNGRRLEMYRNISVPILSVIGDLHEYTSIPIKRAMELMEKENPLTESHQIKNCNHDFEGKEKELARTVMGFLKKIKI